MANMDLGADEYRPKVHKLSTWAENTVNGFGKILDWCAASKGTMSRQRE